MLFLFLILSLVLNETFCFRINDILNHAPYEEPIQGRFGQQPLENQRNVGHQENDGEYIWKAYEPPILPDQQQLLLQPETEMNLSQKLDALERQSTHFVDGRRITAIRLFLAAVGEKKAAPILGDKMESIEDMFAAVQNAAAPRSGLIKAPPISAKHFLKLIKKIMEGSDPELFQNLSTRPNWRAMKNAVNPPSKPWEQNTIRFEVEPRLTSNRGQNMHKNKRPSLIETSTEENEAHEQPKKLNRRRN